MRLWLLGDGDPVVWIKHVTSKQFAEGASMLGRIGAFRMVRQQAWKRARLKFTDRNLRYLGCVVEKVDDQFSPYDGEYRITSMFAAPFVLTDGTASD